MPNTPINQQPQQAAEQAQPAQPQDPNTAQHGQMGEEEKLLVKLLEGMQMSIAQLSQRVDVLEQKSGEAPTSGL